MAKQSEVDTVMITSKGEPTLYPKQISKYLDALSGFEFPFIELQTNGIVLSERKEIYAPFLQEWYNKGLTIPAISIVHFDAEKNRQIYLPYKKEYIDLPELIGDLHGIGYSVRLACVALDGFIDSSSKLEQLIDFARQNRIEQLTVRPVNKPEESRNSEIYDWTAAHHLKDEQIIEMRSYIENRGLLLLDLPHGGRVYDIKGQNVCLTNSLTRDSNPDRVRQLIFFPDGHIRYDWEKEGAILL